MSPPSLTEQLAALSKRYDKVAPKQLLQSITELQSTFTSPQRKIIQPGDRLPDLTPLTDTNGTQVSISTLIGQGTPVLITFYRGGWCPFDNLALKALCSHLDEFDAMGCALVAVSPEAPGNLAKTAERTRVMFPVLSDRGNKAARELGIVWEMPGYLRGTFRRCLDLGKWNGLDETGVGEGEGKGFELPIPASLLVDGRGVVRRVFIEPDYRRRLDPRTALEWIEDILREDDDDLEGEDGKAKRMQRVYRERREEEEEVRVLVGTGKGKKELLDRMDLDVDWSGVWN